MGRKGSRYTLEEKLYYISLVRNDDWTSFSVERIYGIHHSQMEQWLERYQADGVDGLKSKRIKKNYSQEFKLDVVQKYLAGSTSYRQLAREYNIPNVGVIYQWVSLYNGGKLLKATRRYAPMKNGRKTTHTERVEIVQWTIANELNYVEASNHFNVSYGQVYSWVKKFKQDGESALADRRGKAKEDNGQLSELEKKDLEIKRLKARLEYVSTEAAVLKKLQEIERRNAKLTTNIKPFNNSHTK